MSIKKFFKIHSMGKTKKMAPLFADSHNHDTGENRTKIRKKLFQLGHLYAQFSVTDKKDRKPISQQLVHFWKEITENPPPQAVPRKLSAMSAPLLIGELTSFLKRSLNKCGISETDVALCLLGFMLFYQPFAQNSSLKADLVIKYSQTAPLSVEERQQLRNDCVAANLGSKYSAMAFFNKWKSLIEERV